MALQSSDSRHFVSPSGSVMTSGYSRDLGLDQVGIFSTSGKKTTKDGLKALSTFSGIDKSLEQLAIHFGIKKDEGRHGSNKNSRSVPFSLSEVKKVGIAHPKVTEQKFDYWRVGWNGINTAIDKTTSLKFSRGQTLEFQMTIHGAAVSFFNSSSCYTVRTLINVPNLDTSVLPCTSIGDICDPTDCREYTLQLVKDLNNYDLPGGQKLSQYFDIYPIFSTPLNPVTTVTYNNWCLQYCGFGGNHELAAVQAQYPGQKIIRDSLSGKFILTAIDTYTPIDYKQTTASILKGCATCPAGYTEIPEGFAYAVALEDDGVDQTAIVQALPNAVATSAVKTGQDFGVGHYVVVLSQLLTPLEEEAFVLANPTAVLIAVGTKAAFCESAVEVLNPWVLCGDCSAVEQTYQIIVAEDCGNTKFAEIQAAYPELTITQVGSTTNCVSKFETKVVTTTSCSTGCSDAIIQQMYESKAPRPFGLNQYWFPVVTPLVPDTTVACGFEIKAKPLIMNPSECTIEDLPFLATSTRIKSLSGGYPIDYSLNSIVPTGTWSLLQLDRAVDLDNLGGNLRNWEKKGRFYFQDEKAYRSVVERSLTGTQTRLEGLTQYSDAFVTIEKSNKAGINSKEYSYITYHVLVPYGVSTDVETAYQKLAGAAGIAFEVK